MRVEKDYHTHLAYNPSISKSHSHSFTFTDDMIVMLNGYLWYKIKIDGVSEDAYYIFQYTHKYFRTETEHLYQVMPKDLSLDCDRYGRSFVLYSGSRKMTEEPVFVAFSSFHKLFSISYGRNKHLTQW